MTEYTDVATRVPPGKIGKAEVLHDTPDEFARLRAAMEGLPLENRTYVRLVVDRTLFMTDAYFERRTNRAVMERARGDVLVAGLGIGLILDPILKKAKSVTVVEKNADVIALVGRHFPTVNHVHADIFDWNPPKGARWDVIYFDIWPDICEDDLEEAERLEEKFRKHLHKGGWMRSWTVFANESVPQRRR